MISRLILYLTIILIGFRIGVKGFTNKKYIIMIQKLQYICLLLLLFIMGVKIGIDKKVLRNLLNLGFKAFIISIFSVAFSVIFVRLIKGFIYKTVTKGETKSEL